MSDEYLIKVDLAKLARHLSGQENREVLPTHAAHWLKANGFEQKEDYWIADKTLIELLRHDEIIELADADEPETEWMPMEAQAETGESEVYSPPYDESDYPSWIVRPQYTIDERARRRNRAIPGYEKCMIPKMLCGRRREVRSAWRKLTRKLIRAGGDWEKVLPSLEMIHVDDAPGYFITRGGPHLHDRDAVQLYLVFEMITGLVFDYLKDRNDVYAHIRNAILTGMPYFWINLAFVGQGEWFPVMDSTYNNDRTFVARVMLEEGILPWWPHFVVRRDRFDDPWPNWQAGAVMLCKALGFPDAWEDLRTLDPDESAAQIRAWLAGEKQ